MCTFCQHFRSLQTALSRPTFRRHVSSLRPTTPHTAQYHYIPATHPIPLTLSQSQSVLPSGLLFIPPSCTDTTSLSAPFHVAKDSGLSGRQRRVASDNCRILVHSFEVQSNIIPEDLDAWRRRHHDLSKRQEPLPQRHSVTPYTS